MRLSLQCIAGLALGLAIAESSSLYLKPCDLCEYPWGSGFNVDYYKFNETSLESINYDPSNLLNSPVWADHFEKKYNLVDINFQITDPSYVVTGYNPGYKCYDVRVPENYYGLVFQGWFMAPQSGRYTFKIQGDTFTSIQIGSGDDCYSSDFEKNVVSQDIKSSLIPQVPVELSVELEEEQYYPIRLTYFNGRNPNIFKAQYTLPDGTVNHKFHDVFQFRRITSCEDDNTPYDSKDATNEVSSPEKDSYTAKISENDSNYIRSIELGTDFGEPPSSHTLQSSFVTMSNAEPTLDSATTTKNPMTTHSVSPMLPSSKTQEVYSTAVTAPMTFDSKESFPKNDFLLIQGADSVLNMDDFVNVTLLCYKPSLPCQAR